MNYEAEVKKKYPDAHVQIANSGFKFNIWADKEYRLRLGYAYEKKEYAWKSAYEKLNS